MVVIEKVPSKVLLLSEAKDQKVGVLTDPKAEMVKEKVSKIYANSAIGFGIAYLSSSAFSLLGVSVFAFSPLISIGLSITLITLVVLLRMGVRVAGEQRLSGIQKTAAFVALVFQGLALSLLPINPILIGIGVVCAISSFGILSLLSWKINSELFEKISKVALFGLGCFTMCLSVCFLVEYRIYELFVVSVIGALSCAVIANARFGKVLAERQPMVFDPINHAFGLFEHFFRKKSSVEELL